MEAYVFVESPLKAICRANHGHFGWESTPTVGNLMKNIGKVPGCTLSKLKSFDGCLEWLGDDILTEYSFIMWVSVLNILYVIVRSPPYSTSVITVVGVCLRKIYVLAPTLTWFAS